MDVLLHLLLLEDGADELMVFAAAILELLPDEEAADAAAAERAAAKTRHRRLMAALRRERSRTPRGGPWSLVNWTDSQAASYTRFTKVRPVHPAPSPYLPAARVEKERPPAP